VQAKAVWESTKLINGEIKQLMPALLSPTVGDDFKYSVELKGDAVTSSPLKCMLKPDLAGGYILLAVNVDDAVLDATVTLASPIQSLQVMFENRAAPTVDTGGTRFGDRFDPFDVHVYR